MKKLILFWSFLMMLVNLQAAPVAVDGYRHVKTVGAIDEYTLQSNGLQVLLLPDHTSPTLTFMVTYRVGSRNEVTGTTGATHILEHLMFKGTRQRPNSSPDNVKQLLERTGARYNATTWLDRTNYYENVGSEHLATIVALEADRMRNLSLDDADRQSEMTVVRNEYERGENSPFQALYKEIFHTAFVAHPYHHSTIGHRSDIEKVSIDKLREFYDTFYWPNNATVSLVGDFQPPQALALIQRAFGVYPKSPRPIPAIYTEEPPQDGPRRVTVKRPGQLGLLAIAHKMPQATHADFAPVSLLSAILSDGKNSRLYKALTDKSLTTSVSGNPGFNADPSLHLLFLSLAPGASHEQVEKIALQEIERIKKDGVSEAELQAAIAKSLASTAFDRDGSFAVAGNLNEAIAAGDWTLYYRVDESVRTTTAADIQRVARLYFNEDQSTTGWFVPTTAGATAGAAPTDATALSLSPPGGIGPNYYRTPGLDGMGANAAQAGDASGGPTAVPVRIAAGTQRSRVAGIDLVRYATGVKDVVTLHASLPAGRAQVIGNPAVAALTSMLLDKGTLQQDKFAITQRLEAVGASLHFSAGVDTLSINAKCLKKDLPLVLGLMAEQLRTPALSADEFAKVKQQLAGGIKRSLENTDFRAADSFSRIIYPLGHPNRSTEPNQLLAAIETAQLDEVKAFHRAHYGPAHMTLVVVGDLADTNVPAEVEKVFTGWQGGSAPVRHAKAPSLGAAKVETVPVNGKTSVSVLLGQATGLGHQHPDALALRVATAILGSGFTGRLMATVRDQEGLTYGVSASMGSDSYNQGDWRIGATFSPALLEKGLASTRRQLDLWFLEGVTAAEVDARKTNLIGSFQVALSTTDGLATTLLTAIERGYPLSWIDDYPAQIRALTPAQVNTAIKTYLQPQHMILVKAGSLPAAEKQ
ncbi:MAG: insulinase family protein [Rhodoferax sp.]|uniref:M16 family metallopeptidase n=1 Tax=Rhodoferax sp. TaxID=50421 RepID=UPI001B772675|nr:pitrilysin family protein [Rhodoferax sp.]MBP9906328.1 insulinase family protein [Rhodoferax sp.]